MILWKDSPEDLIPKNDANHLVVEIDLPWLSIWPFREKLTHQAT
jgi:Tat protein secretion system quality control protein TatD with DNase activity